MTSIRKFMDKNAHTLDELKAIDEMQVYEGVQEATDQVAFQEWLEEVGEEKFEEKVKEVRKDWEDLIDELKESGEAGPDFDSFFQDQECCENDYESWLLYNIQELREEYDDSDRKYEFVDGYYPMWNYQWVFPSDKSAEDLNNLGIPNLVFYDAKVLDVDEDDEWDDWYPDQEQEYECLREEIFEEWNDHMEEARENYEKDEEDFRAENAPDEEFQDFDDWFHDQYGYEPSEDAWLEEKEFPATFDDWVDENESELRVRFDDWLEEMKEAGHIGTETQCTLVSLTGCGMDLSPSLYYAYFMHSSVRFSPQDILDKILSCGSDYFPYVLGKEKFHELAQVIGEDEIKKYADESKRRTKEFDESLKKLSEARDSGKFDKMTTGLLGLMVLAKSQRPME